MKTELNIQWDSQYNAGDWDYLWFEEQRPRYGLIASWCHTSERHPYTLLDVGCGEGVLLRYLTWGEMERYVGIDWSETAVRRATQHYCDLESAEFLRTSAEAYSVRCDERFDVIVINELIYCCPDPLDVFAGYSRLVKPGGAVVLSICDAHVALWHLIEKIHHRWLKGSWHVGERLSGKGWGISVFRPEIRTSGRVL